MAMELPQNVLSSLRCSQCRNFLSVFPVHTYENGSFVCGRCPLIDDEKPVRDRVYETLAGQVEFPCDYKDVGCLEKFVPADLVEHKPSCTYRTLFCPHLTTNCDWQGHANELATHYGDDHPDYVINETEAFKIPLTGKPYEINRVLEACDEVFLVQVRKIDAQLLCTVRLVGPKHQAKLYNYNFSFYSETASDGLDFPKRTVEPDAEKPGINTDTAFGVDLDTLRSLDADELKCQVYVTKEKKYLTNSHTLLSELNVLLLKHIECPVCFEHMVPPIYQCVNSHVICEQCKGNVVECPTCKVALGNIRNRALENITEDIMYQCKYDGCDHCFRYKEKARHEDTCWFVPYECPFDGCKWKGLFDSVAGHFSEDHFEQVLQYNRVSAFLNNNGVVELFVIKKFGSIFKVLHKVTPTDFLLSVQYYGPRDLVNNYSYCFDVTEEDEGDEPRRSSKKRVYVKFDCTASKANDATFEDGAAYLKLPLTMLEPFKDEIHFNYKIDIVEES